ncbi:MAG: hypothetical protein ABWW69_00775, partial [Pyrodictiaceae archaeon]
MVLVTSYHETGGRLCEGAMTSIGLKPGSEEYKILVKLKRILVKLSPEAIMAFMYIWDNISVGEILFERDLIQLY